MAQEAPPRHYTWDDLVAEFPEDNTRREIIDGELLVSPSPSFRHQDVVWELATELRLWIKRHGGGKAVASPLDTKFADDTVVQPDLLFFRPEKVDLIGERPITVVPNLVVEVSSPSTRRWDRVRKLDVYQRFGVPEYWFVDLQRDLVEVFRLVDGRYPEPRVLVAGDELTTPEAPGFAFAVADLLSL